jgi:hypothetical protein
VSAENPYTNFDIATQYQNFKKFKESPTNIREQMEQMQNLEEYLEPWYNMSRENGFAYPSQGLLRTENDYLDYRLKPNGEAETIMLSAPEIIETLSTQLEFLSLFNHPYRIYHLLEKNNEEFMPPQEIESDLFRVASSEYISLAIGDIAATVHWAPKDRVSRSEREGQGPFMKLGKQARSLSVGSESPDVWNSSVAVAVMAASHCLAAIPRNGVLQDLERQAAFAKDVFKWLDHYANLILRDRPDREIITQMWRNNVMGTLEASPEKALRRADLLIEAGVRSFRPYSPEPGMGPVTTTYELRKRYGSEIEIIAGQIVSVEQAQMVEQAGAEGIVVGIGGGGRCITGSRSGLPIDWPELVWNLRGKINIPIIVQGGASDHVTETLLLGASGIGVSRIVAGGTIESPGGALFYVDSQGRKFKPYGGEASARNKRVEGKLKFGRLASFVEGETTKAFLNFIDGAIPTLTYNLDQLNENAILGLVFRSVESVEELHAINPSPLKRLTEQSDRQRRTH